MRVLIVSLQASCSDGKERGHVHPWIGVVQRLVAGGHEVFWCPLPAPMGSTEAGLARQAGAQLLSPPALTADCAVPPEQPAYEHEVDRAYSSVLVDAVEQQLPWFLQQLEQLGPDCLAADSMVYTAALAFRQRQLPYVAICSGLKMLHEGPVSIAFGSCFEKLLRRRDELFARQGVQAEFRAFECLSPQCNLVFTVPSFARSAGIECVGPSLPQVARGDEVEFPWDQLPEDVPICYASFGCRHSHRELPEVIPALDYACRRLKLFLVLASEYYARQEQGLGPNTLTVPYAPQLQLLPRCSLYVSHGGACSVTEALAAGVPQLAVPLSGDEPLQARLLERASVGAWLPPGATPEQFARVLRWLGTDEGVLARVAHVRGEMASMDGAAAAAERILRLGSRRG